MFTCSVCLKEHQPWSLAFQERKGGKDVCRECKSMMKQSRAVTSSNKKSQNVISALENRVKSLESEQKNVSFLVDVGVKGAIQDLDWREIISPAVSEMFSEKILEYEQQLKSMQNQIVKLHGRIKDLEGEEQ